MLAATGLVRRFGSRVAVDSITFEVRPGEVFGLLGPNGAGKTTTLRMLGGLIPPTEGRVTLGGAVMDRANGSRLRGRIGFLTETPGLWDHLSVWENLAVYGRLFELREIPDAIERVLRRFDLWDRRTDRVVLLSKGMKQKLALGRALLHDPEVILLDEPTANLDPQTARDVRDLLLDLRGRGRVVVVSTHNLDEVERVADRVALISTRLIAIGQPAALRHELFGHRVRIRLQAPSVDPALVRVAEQNGGRDVRSDGASLSMSVDADDGIPALVRALVLAGAEVREVLDETQPLEDVYLRLLERARG